MVLLGIMLDSVQQTVSIDKERLKEIKKITNGWLGEIEAIIKKIQNLVGVLSLVGSCVRDCSFQNFRSFKNKMK